MCLSNMWKTKRNICSTTRPWFFICALLPLMAQNVCLSQGVDTLSPGQSISETQTLVSKDSVFELGFFKTGRSTSCKMYLGIWYKDFWERTVVWVANRDKPVIDSYTRLKISEDGNLVLVNESDTLWSTNLDSLVLDSVEAVLLNSGNFVLRDALKPSTIFWQSFDHPTDTWLPGAKFGMDKLNGQIQTLTSWKNSEDPSPGLYSFKIDNGERNQYVIEWNMSRRYWSSGFWNGKTFSLVPELSYIYEFTFILNEHKAYFTYSFLNNQIMSRLVMSTSGQLLQLTCMRGGRNWSTTSDQPQEKSDVYAICGTFGILNKTLSAPCQCLQGFEESSANNCVGKTSLQCENSNSSNGKRDGFLKIPNVELPADSKAHPDQKSKKSCKLECFRKCSCTAYAYNDDEGCSSWEGGLFGVQQLSDKDNNAQDLYLKLAASDIPKDGGNKMILWVVIPVVVSAAVLVSGGFICIFCVRKNLKQRGEKNSSKDLLSYDFNGSSSANDDETDIDNLRRGASKDVDLPFFSFASVSEATSNFSAENKLGEGGFGPVYKGKSLNGQEIALKRLSKRSGQGLEEFRNEIVLIAKLQHRNLVRLLGCSIEQEESILIYEYMSNKSLDFFIFDPNNKELLDWETRIRIIEGIAQGLLYLHHYSRLRIIHRDLKASNILLDSEMNPKISDFGMARIFGGNESQANTKRIVGTYGYMAPEYAMGGHFSIKSDVFSFGVLLLEIVSGKKNTGFYQSDSLNLLGHAWDLWISDKALELKDPSIAYPSSTSRVLRYINVGLLCVQENPTDRPTMSHVVSMISNDVAALPTPRQPAFVTSQGMNKNVSTNCGECFSVNGLTVSSIEPR